MKGVRVCVLHESIALSSEPTNCHHRDTALTLLSREKIILRAACGGQLAHVLVHNMKQEGCGRDGSVVRYEA